MMRFFRKKWKLIMTSVVVLNFSLSVYAVFLTSGQKRIYTIGVNRLTDSFTQGLNNTKLSKDEQSSLLINFARGLDSSLSQFNAKGGVLMMEEAVLSGGLDITDQVAANIKREIENHEK